MDRLEALADALMKLNGWADPSSQAYQDRNPLLLRAYSLSRAQAQDDQGVRAFSSLLGGYRAALNDLYEKCSGRSRSKFAPDAPLRDLLGLYGARLSERKVILFLQTALAEHEGVIHGRMPLRWFLQTSATARQIDMPLEREGTDGHAGQ